MNKEQRQKIKRAYRELVVGCQVKDGMSFEKLEDILKKELGEDSIEYMLYELGREEHRRDIVYASDPDGFLG